VLSQELRALDFSESSECADLSSLLGLADSLKLGKVPEIEYMLRFEKLLAHGGEEIGAPGEHADVAGMLIQNSESFGQSARAKELEF